MDFLPEQLKRLERFAHYLSGKFPDDEAQRKAHAETARRFELFLLGRDLPFNQETFRSYLLEMHRAAMRSKEERDTEQERLRQYYHCLRDEAEAARTESPAASSPPPSAPETPSEPSPAAEQPEAIPAPFSDLPGEDEIVCPKCGHRQPRADECAKCGVVFEKWKKRQITPATAVGRPTQQMDALRRQLEGQMVERRRTGRRTVSGMDLILLYLVAPLAALFLFGLFRELNASQRERLVKAEQQLVGVSTEIQDIDTPPLVPTMCTLVVPGDRRPPSPLRLYVQESLALTPGQEAQVALALSPLSDAYLSLAVVEELTVSLQRSWVDTSIGTEGLRNIENIWNGKTLFRKPPPDPMPKRPQPLKKLGEYIWQHSLNVGNAVTKPGDYELEATLMLWYPEHPTLFPAAYRWKRTVIQCAPTKFLVRTFEQVRELRAVLETQRSGLEAAVSKLRRHERITRVTKYVLIVLIVLLGALIFYRAFINVEREEERQIKVDFERPPDE